MDKIKKLKGQARGTRLKSKRDKLNGQDQKMQKVQAKGTR